MPNSEWCDKRDIPIYCVNHMLDLVKGLEKEYGKSSIYFRGQEWNDKDNKDKDLQLLPAIGRKQKFCGEETREEPRAEPKVEPEFDLESEVNLLHRFRRWAYLELKRPVGEWEALFLGRHHLLPVRLLDWTSNPLFALYFACKCEKIYGDAAVWVIVKDNEINDIDVLKEANKQDCEKDDNNYYQDWNELPVPADKKERYYEEYKEKSLSRLPKPFRLKGLRILYPFYATPRMNAQQSFFTIQDNPWMPLENYGTCRIDDLKNKRIQIKKLIRWKVPANSRKPIIKELVRLGIHNQVLYPDLDGLAKGLWQIEVVRGWQDNLDNKP